MINKRFQRPINEYTGSEELLYRDKYQKDSNSIPKIAISSAKMDGDFNYVLDAVNTLDEDIKSVVHSGISNQAINGEHIASQAITEQKISNNSVSSRTLQEGAVTNAKLSDLAVTTPKLANNSVTKDKMASLSVGTDEVVDKSITRDKLADDAISDSVPVGTIAQYSIDALPTGWILCSGATVSKNTYPQLVRFLTGSDTTLSSDLPNLNIDSSALAKYAIKAFSDTIELANVEIAGLTQDIDNALFQHGAYGPLPNDRRHTLKVFGAYKLNDEVSISANMTISSGRPMSCQGFVPLDALKDELGVDYDNLASYGASSYYCNGELTQRGSEGRTPWTKNLDVGLSYKPASIEGLSLKIDVRNILNFQEVTEFVETAESGSGTAATPNPNFQAPINYQTPRRVSFTARYKF